MIIINITKCCVCGKDFTYSGYYKKKCCSEECLSKYRKELTTKQHNLNYDSVIGKIEGYVVTTYKNNGVAPTLSECYFNLHIAPKTYYKYCKEYNESFEKILSRNNIPRIHSKFQTIVTKYIREYYNGLEIIEEAKFDECVNYSTGCKLRFDIFIPEINTVIECDGEQHNSENSYFNKLVLESGHTPVYETDKIKEEFCKNKNINIIRIPYTEVVTKEYVESFLGQ